MHVKTIRLVGWKEEEILSISDGSDNMVEVSFWKDHDNPRGIHRDGVDVKGRIIVVKNVSIMRNIEETEEFDLAFGYLKMGRYDYRHIILLENDFQSLNDFKFCGKPIKIDRSNSIIPEPIMGSKAADIFPILNNEMIAMKMFVPLAIRYKMGLIKTGMKGCNYFEKAITRYAESLNSEHQMSCNDLVAKMEDLNL